jgi:hypothetical protein
MKIGRTQGFGIMFMGLVLLATAILVIINVPEWGRWVANYPSTIDPSTLPEQAQPVAGAIGTVFGPLIDQIGGYLQTAGYFIGALVGLVSLVVTGAGMSIVRSVKE